MGGLNPLPIPKVARGDVGGPVGSSATLPFLRPLDGGEEAPEASAPFVPFRPVEGPSSGEGGDPHPTDRPPAPAEEEPDDAAQPKQSPEPSEAELRVMQLERMLQEAKAHAEKLEADACSEAYAKGEAAGLALGRERAEALLDQFDAMLEQAREQMLHIQRAMADAVIDIAQMVAETLIGALSVEQRGWLVTAAARVAENMPVPPETLQLAVHPDDLAELRRIVSEEARPWQVVADATLESGTCRLISQQQDAFIDPLRAAADLVRALRPELQASLREERRSPTS